MAARKNAAQAVLEVLLRSLSRSIDRNLLHESTGITERSIGPALRKLRVEYKLVREKTAPGRRTSYRIVPVVERFLSESKAEWEDSVSALAGILIKMTEEYRNGMKLNVLHGDEAENRLRTAAGPGLRQEDANFSHIVRASFLSEGEKGVRFKKEFLEKLAQVLKKLCSAGKRGPLSIVCNPPNDRRADVRSKEDRLVEDVLTQGRNLYGFIDLKRMRKIADGRKTKKLFLQEKSQSRQPTLNKHRKSRAQSFPDGLLPVAERVAELEKSPRYWGIEPKDRTRLFVQDYRQYLLEDCTVGVNPQDSYVRATENWEVLESESDFYRHFHKARIVADLCGALYADYIEAVGRWYEQGAGRHYGCEVAKPQLLYGDGARRRYYEWFDTERADELNLPTPLEGERLNAESYEGADDQIGYFTRCLKELHRVWSRLAQGKLTEEGLWLKIASAVENGLLPAAFAQSAHNSILPRYDHELYLAFESDPDDGKWQRYDQSGLTFAEFLATTYRKAA